MELLNGGEKHIYQINSASYVDRKKRRKRGESEQLAVASFAKFAPGIRSLRQKSW
ncbi:MAG: hypothetical protein ACPG42_04740 [Alphaproteobacteria bacterium]